MKPDVSTVASPDLYRKLAFYETAVNSEPESLIICISGETPNVLIENHSPDNEAERPITLRNA
jgi:hypothetical protein